MRRHVAEPRRRAPNDACHVEDHGSAVGFVIAAHTLGGSGLATRTESLNTNGEQRARWRQLSSEPMSMERVQTHAVLSPLAVTTRVPSGLNAAAGTPSCCRG